MTYTTDENETARAIREACIPNAIDIKNAADINMEHELVGLGADLADDALPVSNGTVSGHKLKKVGESRGYRAGQKQACVVQTHAVP